MTLPADRIRRSNTWWNAANEAERFLLYYTCLRYHYEMPAQEAWATAQKNWPSFGPQGDLMKTLREALNH